MNREENDTHRIDVVRLLMDFIHTAKHCLLLGVVLVVLTSSVFAYVSYKNYRPIYKATSHFTVKVVNPLQSSVSSYNKETAEQMEKTFPYILTSDALNVRIKEQLDIATLPNISASVLSGSNIFMLTVSDSDPQRAYDVLQAVIQYYPEVADFVIGLTSLVLLDESGVPKYPVNPYSIKSSIVLGGMIGLCLWGVFVLIYSSMRKTVYEESELKDLLNCDCLTTLPATKVVAKKDRYPLIHHQQGGKSFVNSMSLLSKKVQKELDQNKHKVLIVSSAIPGEGKTTVSVNLAVSLALKGKNVMLMDCDLRNSSVHKALDLDNDEGLVQFLNNQQPISDLIKRTDLDNLYVLVSGDDGENHNDTLLNSKRLRPLVQALRKSFDYVIIDTPPSGLLADASEIAELSDCALMVIRQNYANQDQILDGIQYLTDSKVPLLGCVLNGAIGYRNYGYGYKYGYGYNYGYGYHYHYGYGEK